MAVGACDADLGVQLAYDRDDIRRSAKAILAQVGNAAQASAHRRDPT
jgi:hypothetical protein